MSTYKTLTNYGFCSPNTKQNLPWIEKYRPKTLDDIVDHNEKVQTLKALIENKEMTHLLFYGLPGSAKCLAKDTMVLNGHHQPVPVQSLKTGDYVLDQDLNPQIVWGTASGQQHMYTIHQSNGESYTVNQDHILSLVNISNTTFLKHKNGTYSIKYLELNVNDDTDNYKGTELHYKRFDNLQQAREWYFTHKYNLSEKGDIVDISVINYINKSDAWKRLYKGLKCLQTFDTDVNHNFTIFNYDHAYIIGLWIACGYTMTSTDNLPYLKSPMVIPYSPLSKWFAHMCDKNILSPSFNSLSGAFDYYIKDTKLIDTITQICKYRRKNILIGTICQLPNNIKCSIMTAIIDQFGHSHKDYIKLNIQLITHDTLSLIRQLSFSLGWNIINDNENIINIKGNQINHGKLVLQYKQCRRPQPSHIDYLLSDISIEYIGQGEYYGISLSPYTNQRFLLGDYTLTHNTSMIMAVAQQMYGDQYKKYILELNASDERGIDTIRNKIPDFVTTSSDKIRFVILDEADAMTHDAQSALRRVIEKYSTNSRFCLICNNINKIIPGLQSRCTKMRFGHLDPEKIKLKLRQIIQQEQVNITEDGLNLLVSINRDFRQILNTLQCLHALKLNKYSTPTPTPTPTLYQPITVDDINEHLGIPTEQHIISFINILNSAQTDLSTACKKVIDIYKDNQWNLPDLIKKLTEYVVNDKIISNKRKVFLLEKLSDIEIKLSHCNDSEVQLYGLVSAFGTQI